MLFNAVIVCIAKDDYYKMENTMPLISDGPFDDIVCSVMTNCFNGKVLSWSDWFNIFNYLLFSKNLEMNESVFLFLKKNSFFSQTEEKLPIYYGFHSATLCNRAFNQSISNGDEAYCLFLSRLIQIFDLKRAVCAAFIPYCA